MLRSVKEFMHKLVWNSDKPPTDIKADRTLAVIPLPGLGSLLPSVSHMPTPNPIREVLGG